MIIATKSWKGIRPWKRHSLVLMVAGLVYVAIGISYILAEPTETRLIALHYALQWFPIATWGWIYVGAGSLAVLSSRWPPVSETWGYTVLTGLSSAWSLFYLFGVVVWHSPPTNLSGVMSWGLIAFMWWAISGLKNPDNPERVVR